VKIYRKKSISIRFFYRLIRKTYFTKCN